MDLLTRTLSIPTIGAFLFTALANNAQAQQGRTQSPISTTVHAPGQTKQAASTVIPFTEQGHDMLRGGTPPNDLCSGALVEVLDPNTTLTRMGNSDNATDDAGFGAPMVWEGFTVNQCLDVTIDLCGTNPAFANSFVNLKVGCPGLTNLATATSFDLTTCPDGNATLFFPNLGAGTYYFPVIGEPGSVGPYTLNITGVPCAAPVPVNDDCSGAIALTPGTSCTPVIGDCNGSTDSGVPNTCSGDVSDDIWFSFQAMATEHSIIADPSAGYDAAIEFFTGACGGLTSAQCEDVVFAGQAETMTLTGLSIGETYYFRVYDWFAGQPPSTTIDVCVLMAGGTGPVNDLCAGVAIDQLDPGSALNYSGTTVGATTDLDAEPGSILNDLVPKVWHAFSLQECATVTVEYCGSSMVFDEVYAALATTCPADNSTILTQNVSFTCVDGNAIVVFPFLDPGTYYVPIGQFGPGSTGAYNISLSATACPPPPANNDCGNAEPLQIHASLDCPAEAIAGNNATADQDGTDPTCDATNGLYRDVWYSFNSFTNTEVTINFDQGTMTDWAIVVTEGCSGTEVACEISPLDPIIVPTTSNTDYVVRVYSNTQYGNGGDFSICLVGNFPTSIIESRVADWIVFPNPASDEVNVRSGLEGMKGSLELIDGTGRITRSQRVNLQPGQVLTIRTHGLAEGLYTIRMTGDRGVAERLIVLK